MKIITRDIVLLNTLLDYIDSYSASRSRDEWDFTIEMDKESVCSISENKATITVRTSENDYKVINLSSFHDWYIER